MTTEGIYFKGAVNANELADKLNKDFLKFQKEIEKVFVDTRTYKTFLSSLIGINKFKVAEENNNYICSGIFKDGNTPIKIVSNVDISDAWIKEFKGWAGLPKNEDTRWNTNSTKNQGQGFIVHATSNYRLVYVIPDGAFRNIQFVIQMVLTPTDLKFLKDVVPKESWNIVARNIAKSVWNTKRVPVVFDAAYPIRRSKLNGVVKLNNGELFYIPEKGLDQRKRFYAALTEGQTRLPVNTFIMMDTKIGYMFCTNTDGELVNYSISGATKVTEENKVSLLEKTLGLMVVGTRNPSSCFAIKHPEGIPGNISQLMSSNYSIPMAAPEGEDGIPEKDLFEILDYLDDTKKGYYPTLYNKGVKSEINPYDYFRIEGTLQAIIRNIKNYSVIKAEVNRRREEFDNATKDDVGGVPSISKLDTFFPHQAESIARLQHAGETAILDISTGGGKSLIIISEIAQLLKAKKIKRPLVVMPDNLIYQYINAIDHFTDFKINPFTLNTFVKGSWGSDEMRSEALAAPSNTIFLTSYPYLITGREIDDTGIYFPVCDWLINDLGVDYVCLDESQAIKNPGGENDSKGLANKACMQLREAPYRRIATGTLIPKDEGDLPGQLNFLSPGILGTRDEFIANYGIVNKKGILIGYKKNASDKIREVLRQSSYYLMYREYDWGASLPQIKYHYDIIKLTPTQNRVYRKIIEGYMDEMQGATAQQIQDLKNLGLTGATLQNEINRLNKKAAKDLAAWDKFCKAQGQNLDVVGTRVLPKFIKLEQYVTAPDYDPFIRDAEKLGIELSEQDKISAKLPKIDDLIDKSIYGIEGIETKDKDEIIAYIKHKKYKIKNPENLSIEELKKELLKIREERGNKVIVGVHYKFCAEHLWKHSRHKNIGVYYDAGMGGNLKKFIDNPESPKVIFAVCQCFDGDTYVMTDYDKAIKIKDIYSNKSITHILSYDLKKKKIIKKKINHKFKTDASEATFYNLSIKKPGLEGKCTVRVTGNHQIWSHSKKEYVKVRDLEIGEKVITYNGDFNYYGICSKCKDLVLDNRTAMNIHSGNHRKGISMENRYGKKEADFLKKRISNSVKALDLPHPVKGKTWEEYYGKEESDRLKKINSFHSSKTWEERIGKKKSDKMKKAVSKRTKGVSDVDRLGKKKALNKSKSLSEKIIKRQKGKTWVELYGKDKAQEMKDNLRLSIIKNAKPFRSGPNKPEQNIIDLNIKGLHYTGDGSYYINLGSYNPRKSIECKHCIMDKCRLSYKNVWNKNPDFVYFENTTCGQCRNHKVRDDCFARSDKKSCDDFIPNPRLRTNKVLEVNGFHWHCLKEINTVNRKYKEKRIDILNIDAAKCYKPKDLDQVRGKIESFVNNHISEVVEVRKSCIKRDYKYTFEIEGTHNYFVVGRHDRSNDPKDGIPFLVSNSIREGKNLQMANRIIMCDSEWIPGKVKQFIARIYRPEDPEKVKSGKTVHINYLIADQTVDVIKFARVTTKKIRNSRTMENSPVQTPLPPSITDMTDLIASSRILGIVNGITADNLFKMDNTELREVIKKYELPINPNNYSTHELLVEEISYKLGFDSNRNYAVRDIQLDGWVTEKIEENRKDPDYKPVKLQHVANITGRLIKTPDIPGVDLPEEIDGTSLITYLQEVGAKDNKLYILELETGDYNILSGVPILKGTEVQTPDGVGTVIRVGQKIITVEFKDIDTGRKTKLKYDVELIKQFNEGESNIGNGKNLLRNMNVYAEGEEGIITKSSTNKVTVYFENSRVTRSLPISLVLILSKQTKKKKSKFKIKQGKSFKHVINFKDVKKGEKYLFVDKDGNGIKGSVLRKTAKGTIRISRIWRPGEKRDPSLQNPTLNPKNYTIVKWEDRDKLIDTPKEKKKKKKQIDLEVLEKYNFTDKKDKVHHFLIKHIYKDDRVKVERFWEEGEKKLGKSILKLDPEDFNIEKYKPTRPKVKKGKKTKTQRKISLKKLKSYLFTNKKGKAVPASILRMNKNGKVRVRPLGGRKIGDGSLYPTLDPKDYVIEKWTKELSDEMMKKKKGKQSKKEIKPRPPKPKDESKPDDIITLEPVLYNGFVSLWTSVKDPDSKKLSKLGFTYQGPFWYLKIRNKKHGYSVLSKLQKGKGKFKIKDIKQIEEIFEEMTKDKILIEDIPDIKEFHKIKHRKALKGVLKVYPLVKGNSIFLCVDQSTNPKAKSKLSSSMFKSEPEGFWYFIPRKGTKSEMKQELRKIRKSGLTVDNPIKLKQQFKKFNYKNMV